MTTLTLRDPAGHVSPQDLARTVLVSPWDITLIRRGCDRAITAHGEHGLAAHHLRRHLTELAASGDPPWRETFRLLGEIELAAQRALLPVGDVERIASEIGGAR